MAPRVPYGDKPMSPAERVRRSRWVNNFENTVFKLLDLIEEAPTQLPRNPVFPANLLEKLRPFIELSAVSEQASTSINNAKIRVLKLGNGNQFNNKKLALRYISTHFKNADIIDNKTIRLPAWGLCHVAAYTHAKGAMISTPNKDDQNYGGTEWHNNNHILLFRDAGDGSCIIYISKIKPLFDHRTIGHHGVLWGKIEELSEYTEVLKSQDVLKELNNDS